MAIFTEHTANWKLYGRKLGDIAFIYSLPAVYSLNKNVLRVSACHVNTLGSLAFKGLEFYFSFLQST